jgi:hypothetical protein
MKKPEFENLVDCPFKLMFRIHIRFCVFRAVHFLHYMVIKVEVIFQVFVRELHIKAIYLYPLYMDARGKFNKDPKHCL